MFCAAVYMIEKLKEEHDVNVFNAVRFVRLNRPQFIQSVVSAIETLQTVTTCTRLNWYEPFARELIVTYFCS